MLRSSGGTTIEERDLSAAGITFEDRVNYVLENAVASNPGVPFYILIVTTVFCAFFCGLMMVTLGHHRNSMQFHLRTLTFCWH